MGCDFMEGGTLPPQVLVAVLREVGCIWAPVLRVCLPFLKCVQTCQKPQCCQALGSQGVLMRSAYTDAVYVSSDFQSAAGGHGSHMKLSRLLDKLSLSFSGNILHSEILASHLVISQLLCMYSLVRGSFCYSQLSGQL